jgi:hypothetical protein
VEVAGLGRSGARMAMASSAGGGGKEGGRHGRSRVLLELHSVQRRSEERADADAMARGGR